ncbi:hypothetical protein BJ987_006419 [Nocardia goodfellowii]|uniref:Uncharacterized protein n=1 Tax=Nocardia goodfellowii TaxID=882446 RepID=A0ABS4QP97_9NOCA|nr:hypothetical protein [Nocardia goodfellowii]
MDSGSAGFGALFTALANLISSGSSISVTPPPA